MEIISIYIFHIEKKSTLSEKVDMAIFFQWQYRQYLADWNIVKKRHTEISTEISDDYNDDDDDDGEGDFDGKWWQWW